MTTYLKPELTPPDHLTMWDAFRAARTDVEKLYGPEQLMSLEPDLPMVRSNVIRMSAVWFLPNENGTLLNNGFNLMFNTTTPGLWMMVCWTTDVGRIRVETTAVLPQIVLGTIRLAELIP